MENTNEEIQAQIDKLTRELSDKRSRYKTSFEKVGGWLEAKTLHQEIKAAEIEIELLQNRLK